MEAFHITSSLRELARKQRYFHFGSSLLELKIYQALRRFRGIAYITFGMDCAASSNTAPGYDRRYTSGLSGNLEDMGSEMSISRPAPLRNALYEKGWGEGSCFINGYWWGLVGSSGYWRVRADTATVRVQGSHLGAHSELMLWDEFGVYGVEYVRGPCWGTSSGPML